MPKDDGYVVQFQYGRRGSALQSGQKNPEPVSYDEAKAIYDELVAEKTKKGYSRGAEGVVFRHTDAPYIAGRPASGGPNLKHKFFETASFIVGKVNAKRSVSLLLFEGDKIKAAGNVTIPPNHEIPTAGQVLECRYLYAFRESGSIFQPVFLAIRDDISSEECTTAQLKYRSEPAELRI